MITVTILINGHPIFTRSAINRGQSKRSLRKTRYELDDGSEILHKREDGAVVLAKKMLDTIRELK